MFDWLRNPDVDARYFGLTPGHYGSIAIFFIGAWILINRRSALIHRNELPQPSAIPTYPHEISGREEGGEPGLPV